MIHTFGICADYVRCVNDVTQISNCVTLWVGGIINFAE